jgi:hypothetical protein
MENVSHLIIKKPSFDLVLGWIAFEGKIIEVIMKKLLL